jgi:hypothetical protein
MQPAVTKKREARGNRKRLSFGYEISQFIAYLRDYLLLGRRSRVTSPTKPQQDAISSAQDKTLRRGRMPRVKSGLTSLLAFHADASSLWQHSLLRRPALVLGFHGFLLQYISA